MKKNMIQKKDRTMLIKSISYLFTVATFALACKPASEWLEAFSK